MAFTYSLATLRGQARLYIGDSVENQGPRPSGTNFSDEEIDFFISEGVSLSGAAIASFTALAGEWSAFALSEKAQHLSFDAKATAKGYREQAQEIRDNPLENVGDLSGFIPLTRTDAYSELETIC